ncbi:MAG: hypothetical protein R3C08_00840 [Hyphomonas sp.]
MPDNSKSKVSAITVKAYKWKRPSLPDGHSPKISGFGGAMIICGILAIIAGGSSENYLVIAIGAGLLSLGISAAFVGVVVAEVRQFAFETALRAGEVTFEDKTVGYKLAK